MTAIYIFGRFELRAETRQLLVDSEPVPLGARAFDVLEALIERRDRVVPKDELLDLVWPGLVVEENNLQVQVSALRKVLGRDAIATIPGRGYRFTIALPAISAASAPAPASAAGNAQPAVARLATLLAAIDERAPSIAVLPFANLSDDPANEYFADGIAEELLNVLSKIRGLRVASRTSAFSFKGKQVDIATIASKLNVSTLLEGSVRKAGNQVRIAVQLVQVATDSRLWSSTYDRELRDIFAVQDDIARSVVEELRPTLVDSTRDSQQMASARAEVQAAAKGRGTNPEAYRFYLQGKALVARRTQASVATGIEQLRQAVAVEPGYALAWAALARALTIEAGTGGWKPFDEGYRNARQAAEQALALERDLAEGHIALSHVLQGHDWNWRGAEASMRRALELAPGNADVVVGAAAVAGSLGYLDEALALCHRTIALDPLNAAGHRYLGIYSRHAGRYEQAEAALLEAMAVHPFGGLIYVAMGDVRLMQGRPADALACYERESHEGFRLRGLSMAYHALEQNERSDAALEQLGALPMHAFLNATAHAYCGHVDTAFEWLDRAYAQRNAGLSQLRVEPLLHRLHRDARWRAFLAKMGWPTSA